MTEVSSALSLAVSQQQLLEQQTAHDWGVAKAMEGCSMLGKDVAGNPANIYMILQYARALGLPNSVIGLKQIYVVKGNPSISGQLCIALMNRSRAIKGRLQFNHEGTVYVHNNEAQENRRCTCSTVDAQTGQEFSTTVTWKEGVALTERSKPNAWHKMPDQMLCYRAALFHARRYYPDVLSGMSCLEIDEHIEPIDVQVEQPAPAPQPAIPAAQGKSSIYNKISQPQPATNEPTQNVLVQPDGSEIDF